MAAMAPAFTLRAPIAFLGPDPHVLRHMWVK